MHKLSSMALAAATLALTACVDMPSISHQNVGEADTLATKADSRLVYARSRNAPAAPHDVICAEPSPEVAKAFSTAFGASAEAEAKAIPALSQAGDVRGALAVSRARSEAIAQLGKRLGTIQLLRNGLFSACEAYANGAISPISYAFLLSRFGDVMVTLLAVEMVSGDGIASDGTTTEATAPPPGTGKPAPGDAPQDGSAPVAQPVAADGTRAAMKKVAAVKKAGTADQANAQGGDAAAPDKSAPGRIRPRHPRRDRPPRPDSAMRRPRRSCSCSKRICAAAKPVLWCWPAPSRWTTKRKPVRTAGRWGGRDRAIYLPCAARSSPNTDAWWWIPWSSNAGPKRKPCSRARWRRRKTASRRKKLRRQVQSGMPRTIECGGRVR